MAGEPVPLDKILERGISSENSAFDSFARRIRQRPKARFGDDWGRLSGSGQTLLRGRDSDGWRSCRWMCNRCTSTFSRPTATSGCSARRCRDLLLPSRVIDSLLPLTIGWMNVINAMDYGHYDYTLKPDEAATNAGRTTCRGCWR